MKSINKKLYVSGFMDMVDETSPGPGELALFWLGSAGYLIKTHSGTTVAIDPYLSDCCETAYGFKRLIRAVMAPDEFRADYLLMSHEHGDHCDVDLLRAIEASDLTMAVAGPVSCRAEIEKNAIDIPFTTLATGDKLEAADFTLHTVDADHGKSTPFAVGFVLDFGFIKIYYSGDTALTQEITEQVRPMSPDIALMPVNGAFGNLNGVEALQMANDVGAKLLIPCHFWTLAEHGANLLELVNADAGNIKILFLSQGEGVLLP